METIKTYLENMFMRYPNTSAVLKAKQELLQMMEDKYMELKAAGKTENEAIGIVISEFGNLDELADDLGIGNIMTEADNENVRKISLEEVKQFLNSRMRLSCMMALGIAFCILSICAPIIADAYVSYHQMTDSDIAYGLGTVCMFLIIALGVGFIVGSGILMSKWNYLKEENCQIDFGTTDYVRQAREDARVAHVIRMTIGIILCVISVVPVILFDALKNLLPFWTAISPAFLFLYVAVGVFFIVYTSVRWGGYSILLHLSDASTNGSSYTSEKSSSVVYESKIVNEIMSVYWPTVTCIYLSWSFLPFSWHITWIVWVLAAIIQVLVKAIFGKQY